MTASVAMLHVERLCALWAAEHIHGPRLLCEVMGRGPVANPAMAEERLRDILAAASSGTIVNAPLAFWRALLDADMALRRCVPGGCEHA